MSSPRRQPTSVAASLSSVRMNYFTGQLIVPTRVDNDSAYLQRSCLTYSRILTMLSHDAIARGGHNSVVQTAAAISLRFYWPKPYKTVPACLRGCETSLCIKAANQKPVGLLASLDILSTHEKRINIDFVTMLLTS
jgi:hypothetical protein